MDPENEEPIKSLSIEYLDGIPCLLCLKKILPINSYGHIKMCLARYEAQFGLGEYASNLPKRKKREDVEITQIISSPKSKKDGKTCDLPKTLCDGSNTKGKARKVVCISLQTKKIKVEFRI
jgi:hypothetical protein